MTPYDDRHLKPHQDLTRGDTVYVALAQGNCIQIQPLTVVYDDDILIASTADLAYDFGADRDEWENTLISRTPREAVIKVVNIQKLPSTVVIPEIEGVSDKEPRRKNRPMDHPEIWLNAWSAAHESNLANLLQQAGISDVAYAEAVYKDSLTAMDSCT